MTITHKLLAKKALDVYDTSSISKHQVEATIDVIDNIQIIAVRGTESEAVDITRDLLIVPWWFKELGLTHLGFGNGALAILDRIIKKLDKSLPIYLTGHSAGGIISLMVGKILSDSGYKVIEWVGFGTPRGFVGTRKFNFKLTSYKRGKDIVTYLPPPGWFAYCNQVPFTKLISTNNIKYPNAKDHKMLKYFHTLS